MTNPNDVIRDAILRYLYKVHEKARSPKSAGQGIKDLTKGIKQEHGKIKQQEIASNLDYLIQKGWVREVIETRTFTTPKGTTQNSEKRTYKISDTGIDKLEAASIYQSPSDSSKINITNINGVTVVGDGNVVNTKFTDLHKELNEFRQAVLGDETIPNEEKLAITSDIDTLQSQLQKPNPNKTILQTIWSGIEKSSFLNNLLEFTSKIRQMIGPIIS